MTTDRDLIEYVMALPLTPALPLGERREAVRLLLPVVDRIANERAAAELEFAAVGLRDAPAEAAWLRTRAAALRAALATQAGDGAR